MFSAGLLHWLTSDQGLMQTMAQNWLVGVLIVSAIIFLETGLVLLPFLPGDTLLFATGSFLGLSHLSPIIPFSMICFSAILGDQLNFRLGTSRVGNYILRKNWIKPAVLQKTHDFYDQYGAMTVVLGRFIPVVRTIAPFVAGLTKMESQRFTVLNVMGGAAWSGLLLFSGYWLCHIAWVKTHFPLLSLGVVIVSVLPVIFHLLTQFRKQVF